MYHIVSFVYRSLDTNVKAAVVGARVGQGEGRGGGGKVGQGGRDGSASCCFREMARVKQTKVISDVQELRFSEDQRTVLRFI